MKSTQLFNFRFRQPRRNLPAASGRKRGESNFVAAFCKTYVSSVASHGFGGKDFALSGFGIADFIWFAWRSSSISQDGTALSLRRLRNTLTRNKLTAFEMKLTDWRKGLSQAYRYSYFSDTAILVLPPKAAKLARKEIELFRALRVGLWAFDKTESKIQKLFTPSKGEPRNARAKEKAVESLERFVKLCQLSK
jgi:hypothetical protein